MLAGVDFFQEAIDLDPNYALAHCGIADSFSVLRLYGYVSARESKTRAEIAARRAMELSPSLAEAHFSSALCIFSFMENWPSAEEPLRASVQISPRTSLFQVFFGGFLATRRRFKEAEVCGAKSLELDPLSPYVHSIHGLSMYMAERYEVALGLAERALELQADYALGLWVMGFACCKLGRYTKAIDALERLVNISKRANLFVGTLGMAYGLVGRRTDALLLADELEHRKLREYVSPHSLLLIAIGLANRDRIYNDLQACIDEQVTGFPLEYTIGPYIDDLESEPRFAEIFRRLRLVQPRSAKKS
jgi:tetratricopeptide (TPR) repeat protein